MTLPDGWEESILYGAACCYSTPTRDVWLTESSDEIGIGFDDLENMYAPRSVVLALIDAGGLNETANALHAEIELLKTKLIQHGIELP
jgi:hypothetical protein